LSGGLSAAIANRSADTIQPNADDVRKIGYYITSMEDSMHAVPVPPNDTALHSRKSNAAATGSAAYLNSWWVVLMIVLPGLLVGRWWWKA
jgi:hypothetical protein